MASLGMTDIKAKAATPRLDGKPRKIAAGNGLYLWVMPNGAKYWRFKFRYAGKEKLLALGVYPATSLKAAIAETEKARALLRAGEDPSEKRKTDKRQARISAINTFEAVAKEWLSKRGSLAESTRSKVQWILDDKLCPWLGSRPIAQISTPELLDALRRVEATGALETTRKSKEIAGQIFRYAIATGRAERNPAADLRGALATGKTRHHAAIIDPIAVGELLRTIDGYSGQFITRCALKLAPYFFVRPGELRKAEWSEFYLHAGEWRIPAHRMKMRAPHIVPICTHALKILRELHALTGRGRYVFPGLRSKHEPMSENTINAALRRLGYDKDTMTGHGFRAMASTRLYELGYRADLIERQLAHAQRDQSRAPYDRSTLLPERREMMQAWGDYLEKLRAGGEVLPMKSDLAA